MLLFDIQTWVCRQSQTAKQKDLPQRNHFEPLVEDEKLNKLTDRQKRANRQTPTDRQIRTDRHTVYKIFRVRAFI